MRSAARAILRRSGRLRSALAGYRYLRDNGHTRSTALNASVDKSGQSIPWLPYPAIEVLEQLIRPTDSALEIGGGHSTRWLSRRVETVTTVEDDAQWAMKIRSWELPNVEVVSEALTDSCDVILIDGSDDRVGWLEEAENTGARLIVFDNWDRYDIERGNAITISGIAPGVVEPNTTAFVFQRPGECFSDLDS